MSPNTSLSQYATVSRWQANFLNILPAVRKHACVCFRRLDYHARQEAVAATIARALVDYGDLAAKQRLAYAYPNTLADFAVRRVRAGRTAGAPQNPYDLLSRIQSQKIQSLDTQKSGTWRELVLQDRRVSPADQAAFNLDFQNWLSRWPKFHRRMIGTLAAGHRTSEVARRFKVTAGRVSQLRRQYQRSWEAFQGLAQAA
jgi:hypothetical protein